MREIAWIEQHANGVGVVDTGSEPAARPVNR